MYKGEYFNSISHLVGAVFAFAGAIVLITIAAREGDTIKIVSVSIYGFTLVLLYLTSTLYHSLPGPLKNLFRIFDYQAIYLLIAGTYTPFALVVLGGTLGWSIFGTVWGLAIAGIVLDSLQRNGRRILPVIIYLAMGWLCILFIDTVVAALPAKSFYWLLAGGLFYTTGVLFFILDHWYPWCHGIWHLFVLAGSASHYFSLLLFI